MNELHSLLKRQLRRFTGDTKSLLEEQTNFLRAVNDAYLEFDADRRMLEHSLELTSQELLERNAELSRINTELEMRVAARTAELSNSEARFRGLFEHAPVSIWEEDFSAVRQYIDGLRGAGVVDFSAYFDAHPQDVAESATRVKIVDVNRATLEMYQAESKAQLLADLSKVLGPESLIPFKEELLALARGETSFENETINYTLRGERRVVFVRLTIAPGYEQTWSKVFVGISDITERRQAEAALTAERDLLQALMDNIPDTIYFKDASSRFTRINKAQASVLGVAKLDDAIGKTDLDFQPYELAKGFYAEEQELIKSKIPLIDRVEYNPTSDGKPRWFSATKVPILDKDGQVTSIVGVSRNITEHVLAEKKFRGFLESAPDAFVVVDKKGIIQLINSQTEKMFGYDRSEIVGQTVDMLVPTPSQDIHQLNRANFFADSQLRPMGVGLDLHGLRRDGSEFPVEISLSPLEAEDGLLVIAAIRDITKRRQAEAALAAERDLLQALMDNIPDLIYFKDTASRFTRINRAEAGLLGVVMPEEAIGKTDLDFQDPDLAQSFYEEERRLVQTGEALINRIEFNPTPDGQPRWLSTTKVPIKDTEGRVTGIVGVSRDITERKQAEEAVQEAEAKYRMLVEYIPAVVYVDLADESRNTVYINWRVQDMLGYSPEDWITKPDLCIDIVHPEDSERMWKELDESEARGRFACDYRYIAKDGHIVWVRDEAVLIKNEGERPSVWQGVMLDITAQKEAEEALRQSEERFKLMAWATKDAVWDWDLKTNQIWWGEGLQKIFHYSSETAEPNPEWRLDHIHPEDRAKVNRVIDQAMEGGMEFWSKEYRFQRKDGTYADIMDRGYILRDDKGKPYRMIGAMMDITERKYMESTLLQANEQMRQFLNELQRRNSEIALLNEMSRLLQACQSEEEAYRIIADLSNQLFPGTAGALYLLNTTRTLVSAVASWGELPSAERMFAPDDCWALRRGQTHPLGQDQAGLRCLHLSEPLPAVSYCLPMQVQGEILGTLHVQSRHEENLDEAKRQLAYSVVEQSGMALSNLKLREALREQSIRDPITGLYNRRYMEEALKQQLSRVTRQLHALGIIMIDIDHFKDFNDTYGHAAGDLLLQELGQFLQSHIRGEDIACRYGGEEFILILPDVSLEAAQHRAEHLRSEARQLQVQDADQSYGGITLSLGVAIYPFHGRNIETVLRAADAALYRSKQEGRDRVVVAERA